ncbi:MAG: hypothetical protein COU81_00350 [Candidatus Portnoybacteria bacterium CG10_big_fil_rev_8_21_14_0_10_36_7]|uniref:Uncharacterized protein n=1 Tax=Candidatus Portnoybacteria bacterium CG10_big_fil_rev_8_21_14_0_10_36_7 TaxID=1974812 RepID=A0A2M8KF09_9BACT|nr:MAG: hypothetical protein COU81_00350 [Candidatus Portnoybacteria bacterium CG10_big_fil_rev_8_21_14_0_10_36_7]
MSDDKAAESIHAVLEKKPGVAIYTFATPDPVTIDNLQLTKFTHAIVKICSHGGINCLNILNKKFQGKLITMACECRGNLPKYDLNFPFEIEDLRKLISS